MSLFHTPDRNPRPIYAWNSTVARNRFGGHEKKERSETSRHVVLGRYFQWLWSYPNCWHGQRYHKGQFMVPSSIETDNQSLGASNL